MATIADIKALGYSVGLAQDHSDNSDVEVNHVYRVEGFGISTMVGDNDQEAIDSLADPTNHAERKFQAENSDALTAATELQGKGYVVEREHGSNKFTVDGKVVSMKNLMAMRDTAVDKRTQLPTVEELADAINKAGNPTEAFQAMKNWAKAHKP